MAASIIDAVTQYRLYRTGGTTGNSRNTNEVDAELVGRIREAVTKKKSTDNEGIERDEFG